MSCVSKIQIRDTIDIYVLSSRRQFGRMAANEYKNKKDGWLIVVFHTFEE